MKIALVLRGHFRTFDKLESDNHKKIYSNYLNYLKRANV